MCDFITSGRTEPCKDSVGGIDAVYFLDRDSVTSFTIDSNGVLTAVTSVGAVDATVFKYQIRGNSTYTENIQSSRENGTTVFEQVLELTFKKLTKEDHLDVKKLAFSRPYIIIVDSNENAFLAGAEFGIDVTGGTIVTGGAMADMSGYTLTFTGMEKAPANFVFATAGQNAQDNISDLGLTIDID
tara:strand:+ start:54 stop:608 length:555 start_codon:yes stop_codon:yes gene_type:complete